MIKSLRVAIILGLFAAGLAAPSEAAGAAAVRAEARAPIGLGRYYGQRLDWHKCALGRDDEVGRSLDDAGARCAEVTVPLDYADPGGPTIEIAVSRLAASDPGRRIGTMLINGGGPGPAIDMPPYMRGVMGQAGPRYDLIGMDPRSLGRSAPVDCGWPSGTWIRSAGQSPQSFGRVTGLARDMADDCERRHRDLLPHIGTRNIARDMDVIRGALGERRMSYNGASYGTYLGAVYATMFPGRLDRVLLDSAVDPARYGPRLLAGTETANERALADWAAWTAERHATYGLGSTRDEVLGTVRDVLRASAQGALRIGSYRVDDTIVPVVLFNNLGDDRDEVRDGLAGAVRVMHEAATEGKAEPTEAFEEELGFLLSGKESRYGSGQSAIVCGDVAAPRDPAVYWRDIQRNRTASPFFAALTYNIGPCAFWPRPPRERPTRIATDVPALIVAATGDTRTDYASSQALHRTMGGSRLVTLKGANTHAPYQADYGNACVDDQVNAYFVTGKPPTRDTVCG